MPKKPERKSRITPEALKELGRRKMAGEDMRGPFSLTTGKPIKQTRQMAEINAELAQLQFKPI